MNQKTTVLALIVSPTVDLTLLGKRAVQSSYPGSHGFAERAIDGDANPNYRARKCQSTLRERNPWWRVDLETTFNVVKVTVYNRLNFKYRLDNMEIRVGELRKRSLFMPEGEGR